MACWVLQLEQIRQEGAFCINFEISHKTNDDLSNVEDITNKDLLIMYH